MKLGQLLIRKQLISYQQLELVLLLQQENHKKLGELLLEKGLICQEKLNIALKEQYWRKNGFWVIE